MSSPNMKPLVAVIQELSLARSLEAVMAIVRKAARELTGADGATFVLRDGDQCFYAEENAISPLWKGQRFPIENCVSGWVMMHRQALMIEDIYADPRVPTSAYRPTFVKSMMMVPIRAAKPIGAIGNYWATRHRSNPEEMEILQALADTISVALENVDLYAKLEARISDLDRANRAKDEFLMTLSHELRTPLNAIIGWSQLLNNGTPDPEEVRLGLDTISRNANIQRRIVDDLLDTSRVVSGRMNLEPRPVDPREALRSAIDSLKLAAASKEINISRHISNEAAPAVSVLGDHDRLQQVCWNLLSNAIKFTPAQGSIEVRLDHDQRHLRLSVADTGEGIAADFLPFVFDRFRQADSSISRQHGGLGLGLAIVRHLVEAHGGTVHATSPGLGQGAVFTVLLPLFQPDVAKDLLLASAVQTKAPGQADPAKAASLDQTRVLHGYRILVVDDHHDARDLATVIFSRHGATVDTAAESTEVPELILRTKPDLLVCDLGMPGEDGFTLMRRIRASLSDRESPLPAIALTAFADNSHRDAALAAGFDDFHSKPLQPHKLIEIAARLCRQDRE